MESERLDCVAFICGHVRTRGASGAVAVECELRFAYDEISLINEALVCRAVELGDCAQNRMKSDSDVNLMACHGVFTDQSAEIDVR